MAESLFRVLTIRSAGTTAQPALYPLVTPDGGEIIEREPADGEKFERLARASGVTVSRVIDGAERPVLALRRMRIVVLVTNGRLALACRRYPTASVLALAGQGARFAAGGVTSGWASRLRGSVMVGHMRHPWIRSVSALPRRWRLGRDKLAVEYTMPERIPMRLTLDLRSLPRELTVAGMAAEICGRAARHWLSSASDLPLEVRQDLEALRQRAANDAMRRDRRRGVVYQFPVWYAVGGGVPFLRRGRRSRPPYDDDPAGEE
jgi:hypothetical protein